MPYVYECRQCRASSPPGPRRTAEDARQEHRDTEHGGLVPTGERIAYVPGSTPHPDGRYVSARGLLAGLGLLALAETATRLWGR